MTDTNTTRMNELSPILFEKMRMLIGAVASMGGSQTEEAKAEMIQSFYDKVHEKTHEGIVEKDCIHILERIDRIANDSKSCHTRYDRKKYKTFEFWSCMVFSSDRSKDYKHIIQILCDRGIKYEIDINLVQTKQKWLREPTIKILDLID